MVNSVLTPLRQFVGSSAKTFLAGLIIAVALALSAKTAASDDKIKIEELISKHLESLGSSEARRVRARVVRGITRLAVLIGGAGNVSGNSLLVSTGPKMRFGMLFSLPDYPAEEFAFDGSRATTSFLP